MKPSPNFCSTSHIVLALSRSLIIFFRVVDASLASKEFLCLSDGKNSKRKKAISIYRRLYWVKQFWILCYVPLVVSDPIVFFVRNRFLSFEDRIFVDTHDVPFPIRLSEIIKCSFTCRNKSEIRTVAGLRRGYIVINIINNFEFHNIANDWNYRHR